jgi:hypothetical protein
VVMRRRSSQPPDPVSVNARLVRMPTRDLHEIAETQLMMAGQYLSTWANGEPLAIEQAIDQAEQALEVLRALRSR